MDYSKVFLLLIILVLVCVAIMYYKDSRDMVVPGETARDPEIVHKVEQQMKNLSVMEEQSKQTV